MGSLRKIKSAMKKDKELSALMVRSGRNEILLDLDGDKIPDIGLLDINGTGEINAFAVDLTGNGEFNLYLADNDNNGVPDEVSFYEDGEDMPVQAFFGRAVEERLLTAAAKADDILSAACLAADDVLSALQELESDIEEAYRVFETEEKCKEQ